jgi:glucokinase
MPDDSFLYTTLAFLRVRGVLAIDIGGTKMAAAVVDADGQVLSSDRIATLRSSSADELFDSLETLSRSVVRAAGVGVDAIGVGCGGPMQYPAGIVSPLNIPAWRDFPLRPRLSEAFGLPCVLDNDAKALALGERWKGAGRGSDNMLGMVVSTGVGGGIILGGHLLHGFAGNSGHVGHIIVWPDGPLCGCGAYGCLEAVASGSGLTRRLGTALLSGVASTLDAGASAAEIAEAARAGDALAIELLRTAGEGVGRGIASAAALLDLELVVIGGSIALKAWDLIGPPLQSELTRSARLDFTRNVRVVQAELGDSAGVYGAARLALAASKRP